MGAVNECRGAAVLLKLEKPGCIVATAMQSFLRCVKQNRNPAIINLMRCACFTKSAI